MNTHYASTHCREMTSLRADIDAIHEEIELLTASFRADLERLQAELDRERQARQTLDRRVQWNEYVGAA